jgi:hypothetical protein
MRWKITGLCFHGPIPYAFRVNHYLPIALFETTPGTGESLLAAIDFSSLILTAVGRGLRLTTGQQHNEDTDSTFESHIWGLPSQDIQKIANPSLIGMSCFMCSDTYAIAPPVNTQGQSLC